MQDSELIAACLKNDKSAKKELFDAYYGKLAYIALRYCKNQQQADNLFSAAFADVLSNLNQYKNNHNQLSAFDFCKNVFIKSLIKQIKAIRNEYYVASTVKAVEKLDNTYDLFLDGVYIDLKSTNKDVILKSLQDLVPSQRLVFNLNVIDGFNLTDVSLILETNEQTIKVNLEKARFNLQKGIEKNLKHKNNEQPV